MISKVFYGYDAGTPSGDIGCEVFGTMKDGIMTIDYVKYHSRSRYLANGARFKLRSGANGCAQFTEFPAELIGKWVALVDATDGKHLAHLDYAKGDCDGTKSSVDISMLGQVPKDVFDAAKKVSLFFKNKGINQWEFLDLRSRDFE